MVLLEKLRACSVGAVILLGGCVVEQTQAGTVDLSGNEAATVTGVSAGRGATCAVFKLDNGQLISVIGNVRDIAQPGIRARLSGNWQKTSTCQQGRTLRVAEIERL